MGSGFLSEYPAALDKSLNGRPLYPEQFMNVPAMRILAGRTVREQNLRQSDRERLATLKEAARSRRDHHLTWRKSMELIREYTGGRSGYSFVVYSRE